MLTSIFMKWILTVTKKFMLTSKSHMFKLRFSACWHFFTVFLANPTFFFFYYLFLQKCQMIFNLYVYMAIIFQTKFYTLNKTKIKTVSITMIKCVMRRDRSRKVELRSCFQILDYVRSNSYMCHKFLSKVQMIKQ